MAQTLSRNIVLIATALGMASCQGSPALKTARPAARNQQAQGGAGMAMLTAMAREAQAREQKQTVVALLEEVIRTSPYDLQARGQLAQAYFAAGRFRAAGEAYQDALAINPGDDSLRLKRALALLAQGEQAQAIAELGQIRSSQDAGLAYALAGETKRGIELLTEAARDSNATARTRQNLALAYALDGQWARARTVAAQDLDPATLEVRVRQWAELASTADPALQTAWLVSVTPASEDAGRPVALAYVAPVQDQRLAAADNTAITGQPVVQQVAFVPASANGAQQVEAAPPVQKQWVVQLGAYATADLLETNWQQISRRNKMLQRFEAIRIEAQIGQQVYHRLAVGGFETRAAANSLCKTLQTHGRDCFVRNIGDTPPVQVARISEPTRV